MSTKLEAVTKDIDYLIPLINYLGSNPWWWARSSSELAKELALDPIRVDAIFSKYDNIFRKSELDTTADCYYYSLQARYARRDDGKIDEPPKASALKALSEAEIIALIDFLFRIATMETTRKAALRSTFISISAALVSAAAAIVAATLR